jgi:acetoin utilization protein AcuB
MKIKYKGFMRDKVQRDVLTITPDTSFFEVQKLINEKTIRHFPVVDKNNKVIGIVTSDDIRRAGPSDATTLSVHELSYLLGKLKVSSFMTPKEKLITITPDTLFEEAVQLMSDHKVGCLPIVENEKLYGLFTETDALSHLADIYGFKEKGTRLSVAIEDKPGMMVGVFEVIKEHNVNVISAVLSSYRLEDGKRIVVTRVETENYEPLVKDLEKAGYAVLSIGKWPSV